MHHRGQNGSGRRLNLEPLEERLLLDAGGLGTIAPAWFEVLTGTPQEAAAGVSPLAWAGGAVDARDGFWIVQLTEQAAGQARSVADVARLLPQGNVDFQVVRGLGAAGQVLIHAPGVGAAAVSNWLGRSANVAWFEPDAVVHAEQVPNDPGFPNQWGLDNTGQNGGTPGADVDAAGAWNITTGSASVVIGIIDTGVAYTHPDLAPNMWVNPGEIAGNGVDDDGNGFVDDVYGYDFADNDADPGPGTGHGTRVAGIAAGAGNNGIGTAGMAWDASIMALKIFSDDGTGLVSAAIEALNYAAMMRSTYGVNIRVTNNSWVVDYKSNSLRTAVLADGNAGILTVAAAGNGSFNVDNSPLYPAAFDLDTVVSVAGSDRYDHLADFSVWGPTSVDLAAPGASIYAPTPGSLYSYGSGVSYSTPFVSGVAALAWSAVPSATLAQVRDAILGGVDPLPSLAGKMVTGGRLNALNTLQALVLQVSNSTPAAGATVTSAPTVFTIDFSLPVDPASLSAGALRVNGLPAGSYTVLDADTVRFTYATTPVVNQGAQVMHIPAGAVQQAGGGAGNADWTASFCYDSLALAVTDSTPRTGQHLSTAPNRIVLDFNEPVKASSVGLGDLMLSVGTVTGAVALDADTVAYTVSGLPVETWVSWSLAPGALTDTYGSPGVGYAGDFTVDGPAVARYDSAATPTPLVDSGTLTSDITVPDSYSIADIDVLLDVTQPRDSDLRVTLIAPDGTRVPLFDRVGGAGADFDGTLLDADAPDAVTAGIAPFAARYRSQGDLALLRGKDAQGTWTLEVTDVAAGQTGTLNGWSLFIATPTPDGPRVLSSSPSGVALTTPSSLTLQFSEPMDPGSFSPAADIVFFTGPTGDLRSQITGFTWTDERTLRVNFAAQAATGDYTMVLGPQILDWGGTPMDQNANGISGETPGDRYTASFSYHGLATVSVALLASSDSGASDSDGVTNDTTPTYAVTVNGPGTVRIDWQGNGTDDLVDSVPSAGTYQYTPAYSLSSGTYPVHVTFVTPDPQTATAEAPTVIDTVAPATPAAPALSAASDTGASNNDGLTNDTTPTLDVGDPGGYYRLARDGAQVSDDYAVDTYFTDSALADGTYAYTLRAVDAAGNASAPSAPLAVTVDTHGPTVSAVSPSGTVHAPVAAIGVTFSDPNGMWAATVVDKANYLFYSSGGAGSFGGGNQLNLSGRIQGAGYDPGSGRATLTLEAPQGDEAYQVHVGSMVRDAAGNTLNSGAGYSFTFTVDASAPTVDVALATPTITDNLVADDTPTYNVVVNEPGRVLIDWDGGGAVDLAATAVAAGAYQFSPAGPLAAGLYPVQVTFIDTAGNQVQAEEPTTVAATIRQGDVAVTLVGVDGGAQVNPADVAVKFGKDGSVSSIKLGGAGSMEGLGILISGATSVGSIKDGRKGALADLAFIASSAPVKSISLKSGLTGYDINGLTTGDLAIPADIDGDGDAADVNAVYAAGPVGSIKVGADVQGDVWIGGADNKGLALKSFQSKAGGYHGELVALGDVGAVKLGGDLGSGITVLGALKGLTLKAGSMTAGARVFARDGLGKLGVGGSLLGGPDETARVQVLAPTIGSVKVGGDVVNARLLAGADLGADWAVGGAGVAADTFRAGSVGKVSIGGSVTDSLIGAGLVAHDGAFDLAWLAANSAFLDGSLIGGVAIRGALTSSTAGTIPFGIGAYRIGKVKVGIPSDPSLTVAEV